MQGTGIGRIDSAGQVDHVIDVDQFQQILVQIGTPQLIAVHAHEHTSALLDEGGQFVGIVIRDGLDGHAKAFQQQALQPGDGTTALAGIGADGVTPAVVDGSLDDVLFGHIPTGDHEQVGDAGFRAGTHVARDGIALGIVQILVGLRVAVDQHVLAVDLVALGWHGGGGGQFLRGGRLEGGGRLYLHGGRCGRCSGRLVADGWRRAGMDAGWDHHRRRRNWGQCWGNGRFGGADRLVEADGLVRSHGLLEAGGRVDADGLVACGLAGDGWRCDIRFDVDRRLDGGRLGCCRFGGAGQGRRDDGLARNGWRPGGRWRGGGLFRWIEELDVGRDRRKDDFGDAAGPDLDEALVDTGDDRIGKRRCSLVLILRGGG